MKRLLLVALSAVAATISLRAQFALTPSGFVNDTEYGLDYYAIDCQGKSQEQLFNQTAALLVAMFNDSPYEGVTVFPNESLSLNAVAREALVTRKGLFGMTMNVRFNIQIEFRDGRLRIMAPRIREISRLDRGTRDVTEKLETRDAEGKVISTDEITREQPYTNRSVLFISSTYPDSNVRPGIGASYIFKNNGSLRLPEAKATMEQYFNNLTGTIERDILRDTERW